MKKIYSSLAAIALSATTAFAAQPLVVEQEVFQIGQGSVPSQEVINRHLRNHGAATTEIKGLLKDGRTGGVNTYTQDDINRHRLSMGIASSSMRKVETSATVTGNYVNFYMPYFSNQISGMEISQGVVVAMDTENNVVFDGLCGTGVVSGSYNKNYSSNANLKGTYDPATKKITCPGGQIVAVTDTKSLMISPATLSEGKFSSGKELVFDVLDDGTIKCTTDLYMHPQNESGGYGAQISPVLQKATGMISYTSSISGQINRPFWYKFTKNDAGKDVLLMSGLDQYQSAGYTTEWLVDGNTAKADSVLGWSNKNSTQDLKFYLSTLNGNSVESTSCVVDFSNKNDMVFPADASRTWSLYDGSGYWTGNNSQAHITPLTDVTFPTDPDDPEPGDDHGKGTTKDYINIFKPLFSNWDANKSLSEVVKVTIYEDNYVEVDGLCGIGVEACKGNSSFSSIVNLHGTYNPTDKTISIPAGQNLGKFAGRYDLIFLTGDEQYLLEEPLVLTENAEGQLITASYMAYVGAYSGEQLAGGLGACISPVFNAANGKITYEWMAGENSSGTIDEPFYYAIVTKGKNKYLRTSNLANRAGSGYMVDWLIDESTKTATAKNAACYNDSEEGDFILQSTTDGKNFSTSVVADIANTSKITFPTSGYWCTLSDGGSFFGLNATATITGTPVELSEEASVAPLYIAGDFNEWNMNEPIEMAYDKETEIYSYTLPAGVTEFGLSTGAGATAFNAGSLAIENKEKIADNTGETKYTLTNTLDNIRFEYSEGQWTVYVDLAKMQIWATNPVSGIENVVFGNDTPAVYYNLQGIRVNNPVKGNIYIKHQGNDVNKVLVK